MIRPPSAAELILESLGAPAALVEPILGDLAEEFSIRVERDGVRAARRWYYRESLRAAPHLLRAGARALGIRNLGRLAGIVVVSYFFTLVLASLLVMMSRGVSSSLGVTLDVPSQLALAVSLLAGAACSCSAGWIAAWLDTRAPLVSAIALGAAWACAAVVVAMVGSSEVPAVYRVCAPAILLVSPIVGGLLRVRALARASGEERITS